MFLLSPIKEYKDYKSITDTLKELKTKRDTDENFIQSSESRKNRKVREMQEIENNIKRYQEYIDRGLSSIEEHKKTIETWATELEKTIKRKADTDTVIQSLTPQKEELYQAYRKVIDSKSKLEVDTSSNPFVKNLNKKGIYIEDIVYLDNGAEISVTKDYTLTTKAKEGALLNISTAPKLHKIVFKITKPVIIRVDPVEKGENCPKIVSGPYYVELYANQITLSPLASNFIFGHNPSNNNYWIHPHASSRSYSQGDVNRFLKNLTETTLTGCLGEASSALYNAFQAQDPRQCILAAMTWITSANSSDAWGKHWKYFPTLAEVKGMSEETSIHEINKAKIEKGLVDADSIISNIFENELDTTYYDTQDEQFILDQENQILEQQAREAQELQNQEEDETLTENLEVEQPLPQQNTDENNVNLRTPGVSGYVPLSSINR